MKKGHKFKKLAAAGILGLSATFNAHAAPAPQTTAPQTPTVEYATSSWSNFLDHAHKGDYTKIDIVGAYAVGFHTDKKTGVVTETKTRTLGTTFAYNNLKGTSKDITFPARLPAEKPKAVKPAPKLTAWQKIKKDAGQAMDATLNYLNMTFMPMLPMVAMFVVFMLWYKRTMMGGGKKNDNMRKPINPQNNTTRFKDIAGQDSAKQEVQEIISFLKNPKAFRKVGATCPRGCLLSGPPGTGKTLMAKAVAGEAGVPFYSVSGSDFVEMFVGLGAARVRSLFAAAKKQSNGTRFKNALLKKLGHEPKMTPCIIYIDELDAIGKQRGTGGGGTDERENTLNQILVEMDGFLKEENNVIVLGSTNRPEMLDAALLRPGRFTRRVTVDLPDIEGREAILKIHTKNKPLAEGFDLHELARKTTGYSGADLENLANEAAILCARRDGETITTKDFRDAKDKIDMGLAGKVCTDPERKANFAYHEAGHTLVMLHAEDLDMTLNKVTIVPRGNSGGHMAFSPKEDGLKNTVGQLEDRIRYIVGGRAAEEIIFGENDVTAGAVADIEVATRTARMMIEDFGMSKEIGLVKIRRRADGACAESPAMSEKVDRLVKEKIDAAYAHTLHVLEANIDNLHILAHELMEKETLDADEVRALVKINHVDDPRHENLKEGAGIKDIRRTAQAAALPHR